MPLFVGRDKSINALEAAMSNNQKIFLVAQKTPDESLRVNNLYQVGTVASILQLLRLPDGTFKVLIEGNNRAKALSFLGKDKKSRYLSADCEYLLDILPSDKKSIGNKIKVVLSKF